MAKRFLLKLCWVLAISLAVSLTYFFGSVFLNQTPNLPPTGSAPQLFNFGDWQARYRNLEADQRYVVPLSYFLGFSERFTKASGKAALNFETGRVSIEIEGLALHHDGSSYEVLLVDNKSGPGNSVALDTGPNGDDIINLGHLKVSGSTATMEKNLNDEFLREFEVDMVVVRLVAPDGSAEFVIGGLTSLFYKWNRSASRNTTQRDGFGAWIKQQAAPLAIIEVGEASQVNKSFAQLIYDGEQLFFDETFDGNGRTCGTCHRSNNNFTLDPDFIATLPSTDPLFVAENNAALAKLENPSRMRGDRGLILENIDGFDQDPVFRAPPPMINLNFTGPYGLSGEFATIAQFTTGAVMQHFTKNTGGDPDNITRVDGADFRLPTQNELDAMEAFMFSVFAPNDQNFTLSRFVTTEAQQRGQDLFFGDAKCSECHGGTVLSEASAALGGGNGSFNTGVVNLAINGPDGDDLPLEAERAREFSTPPLFNVKNTAPFFHDNSVATLRGSVEFYNSFQFTESPGATAVGGISVNSSQVDDIVAFLEALVAPAAQLAFPVQPSNTAAGDTISPAVQVAVQDDLGNEVSTATDSITIDIGSNPGGGTLTGAATQSAVNGEATFSGLRIDRVGSGYTLLASTQGLTGSTSAAFNITGDRLGFAVEPGNTEVNATISPDVEVAAQDAFGNTDSTFTGDVSLAIGSNPGGGTLSGTTTQSPVSGVATFTGLSIDKAGTGYTLQASTTGLTGSTSVTFNITAAPSVPDDDDDDDGGGSGGVGGVGAPPDVTEPAVTAAERSSETVTPNTGGIIDTGFGDVVEARIEVPPGAVDQDVNIQIEAMLTNGPALPPPPAGTLSRTVRFSPLGFQFLVPVLITFNYGENAEASIVKNTYSPVLLLGNEWVRVEDCTSVLPLIPDPCLVSRDMFNNEFTITTSRLSIFGVQAVARNAPVIPEAAMATALKPLGDHLEILWHFEKTKGWTFYDPRPVFAAKNTVKELVPGEVYWIKVSADLTTTLNGRVQPLYAGANLIDWPAGAQSR